MKRLLIVGAGGFGREIYSWAKDVEKQQGEWEIAGFLDENAHALDGFVLPASVVGDPETYMPSDGELFLCAIGDPATKLEVCQSLEKRGAQFMTLIHPTAIIGSACELGRGCLLCPGAVLTSNVTLGSFVTLNVYATVGHDALIGDGCTLSGHVDITGFAKLGEGVFLGSHAVVLPNARVGEYAIIGAGSAVFHSAKAHSTVLGVPAKQIFRPENSFE